MVGIVTGFRAPSCALISPCSLQFPAVTSQYRLNELVRSTSATADSAYRLQRIIHDSVRSSTASSPCPSSVRRRRRAASTDSVESYGSCSSSHSSANSSARLPFVPQALDNLGDVARSQSGRRDTFEQFVDLTAPATQPASIAPDQGSGGRGVELQGIDVYVRRPRIRFRHGANPLPPRSIVQTRARQALIPGSSSYD